MVERKGEKAANTFVKKARPIITKGPKQGQRASERITAFVQVIPDAAFNIYGRRKLNGFTLAEIEEVIETGRRKEVKDEEGRITAWLDVGDLDHQFTKEELREIVTMVKGTGVIVTASPMDPNDLERMGRSQAVEEARDALKSAPARNRPGRPRKVDRGDSEPAEVQV